jgi:hypothetical protein
VKQYPLSFRPYVRRDPVSGETQQLIRSAHSRQSSTRLKEQQRCVRQGLEGKTYRGSNPADNARAVRSSFSQISRGCARGGGRARAATT